MRGRVSNAWEAQEILSHVEHQLFEGLLKDAGTASLLAKVPASETPVVIEGTMRTWDSQLQQTLGENIRKLPYSEVITKDSGKRFYEGGLELALTIISLAANIGTLAKIIYDYAQKRNDRDKPSVIHIKKEKETIHIDFRNTSIREIREVLKRCIAKTE